MAWNFLMRCFLQLQLLLYPFINVKRQYWLILRHHLDRVFRFFLSFFMCAGCRGHEKQDNIVKMESYKYFYNKSNKLMDLVALAVPPTLRKRWGNNMSLWYCGITEAGNVTSPFDPKLDIRKLCEKLFFVNTHKKQFSMSKTKNSVFFENRFWVCAESERE